MKMRFLGKTGLQVSELCLGTGSFGGRGVYKKTGAIGQKEADFVVGMALDAGLNFFNTAETYSDGLAEEIQETNDFFKQVPRQTLIHTLITVFNTLEAFIHRHLFITPMFEADEQMIQFLKKILLGIIANG